MDYLTNGPFAIGSIAPKWLTIHGSGSEPLVSINLEDGSMSFGPSYEPKEAARVFWDAMLQWKAAHPDAQS
jgi:hypothetical protein